MTEGKRGGGSSLGNTRVRERGEEEGEEEGWWVLFRK